MHPHNLLLNRVFEAALQINGPPALSFRMMPALLTFLCQVVYLCFHHSVPLGILRTLSVSTAQSQLPLLLRLPLIVLSTPRSLPRIPLASLARNQCTFTCAKTRLRKLKRVSQRPRLLIAIMGKSRCSFSSPGLIRRSPLRPCPRH